METNDDFLTGTVESWFKAKAFGFIKTSGSNRSYFFHASQLGSAVIEGDKVKFKIGEYRNEPVATDVTKITET